MLEVDYDTFWDYPPEGHEYQFRERHSYGWELVGIVKSSDTNWRVYWKRVSE